MSYEPWSAGFSLRQSWVIHVNWRTTPHGFDGNTPDWTRDQPIEVPGRRAGLLTHPAWLVAHSGNFDNDVVGRGHWIREHLLAGKIPNVPIEVEARVPDEPESTLRERMRVTREDYCLRCHTRMDPLGFPFNFRLISLPKIAHL